MAEITRDVREHLASGLALKEHASPEQRESDGKARRHLVARDSFGAWTPPPDRPDPVACVLGQDATRAADLIGVRHERMAVSPFTFFRGSALLMAQDLARLATSGLDVQLCGDAHIANFGLFLSPERRMVFDINDFDETARGPWEWDIARLCASVELCARHRSFDRDKTSAAVEATARSYREAMRSFAQMGNIEMWYHHIEMNDALTDLFEQLGDDKWVELVKRSVNKAYHKDNIRAMRRFTQVVDGKLQVVSEPPLIVPMRELFDGLPASERRACLQFELTESALETYRSTLSPEILGLLDSYQPVDAARKVVGVGSVGLRSWIVVCEGTGPDDPLVLQLKEAQQSVVEQVLGPQGFSHHGQRVVAGQRAIQLTSDVLLGWTRMADADTGFMRDYYVRQLWNGKGAFDLERICATGLRQLAEICANTLAHAHARTGDRIAIAAYLGASDVFDRGMRDFARTYADVAERDHAAFVAALDDGRHRV